MIGSLIMLTILCVSVEGQTIELIHITSPLSPFYNTSATPEYLSVQAVSRSVARGLYLATKHKVRSTVIPDGDLDFLMKLSIGTPPVDQLVVLDTGSDLTWIQCNPCVDCYKQNSPVFNPSYSSSYKNIPCTSQACLALSSNRQCDVHAQKSQYCSYQYSYGDSSSTNGELATDNLTFDGHRSFRNFIFGCGSNNGGTYTPLQSGIAGLGRGHLSLISQLSDRVTHKRFSYCLVAPEKNPSSKLRFGKDAGIIRGKNNHRQIVSTPIISNADDDTFYNLNLEAVTVGNTRLLNDVSMKNIVIDSGTTLSLLPSSLYFHLETAVREMVGLTSVQYPDPELQLCYDRESFKRVRGIRMIFHFQDADITLNKVNLFIDAGYNLSCLAMLPSTDIYIYGNRAQINFQVEYDLGTNLVSFAPATCTKY